MCYNVLNQKEKVISRSSVQRVTNLELETSEYRETFNNFDSAISQKLGVNRLYDGDKPSMEDWEDMASDPDFLEEFQKVFNNPDIPEADNFTPEVLEDTYVNMELAMPRGEDGPEFARVIKRLIDANGIPIGKLITTTQFLTQESMKSSIYMGTRHPCQQIKLLRTCLLKLMKMVIDMYYSMK